MPPTEQSLDDEIAEVEGRLAHHRMQLRVLSAEARSRVNLRAAVPIALAAALAVGFAASRFTRKPAPAPAYAARRPSGATRLVGALASVLLPTLVRPLQSAATEWVHERMRRPHHRDPR
jgi:hypothetical protein